MNSEIHATASLLPGERIHILWIRRAHSQRIKQQGLEADNSLPSSAKVKKDRAIPFIVLN